MNDNAPALSRNVIAAATAVLEAAKVRGAKLATAESCTGGLVAAALTEIAGASAVFDRAFVTYSNAAKTDMLGVPPALLERHGAVSEETARAMAEGALARSPADIAVAITGIAGPSGGTAEKPVGLVWFALAGKAVETRAHSQIYDGEDRSRVRELSAIEALGLIHSALI